MKDRPYIQLIGGMYAGKRVPDSDIAIRSHDLIRITGDSGVAFYLVNASGDALQCSGRVRTDGRVWTRRESDLLT